MPSILMPKIEAIHPGATRNHNHYMSDRLRGDPLKHSGIYSWTYPYPKPICYDHDTSSVRDISGRVYNAQYVTNAQGQEAVVIIPKITNKEDIRRILDGEFLTVSISATTDSATCSICGTNLMEEEFCGHYRGETYNGQVCEYIIGDVWFDECSWVTVPADQQAQVVDLGVQTAEAYAQMGEDIYSLSNDPEHARISRLTAVSEGLILKEAFIPENKNRKKEGTQLKLDPRVPIDFATAEQEAIQAMVNDLVTQFDEANASIATITAEKTAAETAKTEAEAKVATAEEDLVNTKATLTAKETELAEKESKLIEADAKVAELDTANAKVTELETQYHEALVERVVEYKVFCSKVNANEKDAEKELLKGRSNESLKDSLSDLMREFTGVATASLMNSVKNPAGGVTESNNNKDVFPGKESDGELDPATLIKNRLLNRKK